MAEAAFTMDATMPFTSGMDLFGRLIRRTSLDLKGLDDEKRAAKYQETLDNQVGALIALQHMNQRVKEFVPNYLGDIALERLEGMNDWLVATSRYVTVEQERIDGVVAALDELISEIRTTNPSELDEFLLRYLNDLRLALKQFALFGPEGVEDALRRVSGQASFTESLGASISAATLEHAKKAGKFVAGAVAVLAFVYSTAGALGWMKNDLIPALTGPEIDIDRILQSSKPTQTLPPPEE